MTWSVPAQPENIPTASAQIVNGRVLVMGYAVAETTGSATAALRLRDGTTSAGTRILPIHLAINESVRDWFGPNGIVYEQGIFVEVVSGAIEGSIYCIPETLLGPDGFRKLIRGLTEGAEYVGQPYSQE